MNYLIHAAPDIEPQIQTCLLATHASDIPCSPDCETCADNFAAHKPALPLWATAEYESETCIDSDCPWHGVIAQMHRHSLAIQAAAQEWFKGPYRREYEKIVAEEEAKILKAAEDFIHYGYCEVVVDAPAAKS